MLADGLQIDSKPSIGIQIIVNILNIDNITKNGLDQFSFFFPSRDLRQL